MATSRRNVVQAIAGVGLLGSFLTSAPIAFARSPVVFPAFPMILTRRQERSLRNGSVIRVVRSWRVGFRSMGDKIAVTGAQLDVDVDAPESLAALAAIERNRSTRDMWPIVLSSEGRIVDAGTDVIERDFATAIAEAGRVIRSEGNERSDRSTRLEYLARLQNIGASLLDSLPEDLFFPDGTPRNSRQSVDLPGGLTGEIAVAYSAYPSSQSEWLDRAERRVTTRIGETEKYALEEWTLVRT